MTMSPRPDPSPEPPEPQPGNEALFAEIPAFDVVDGELMPRQGRARG